MLGCLSRDRRRSRVLRPRVEEMEVVPVVSFFGLPIRRVGKRIKIGMAMFDIMPYYLHDTNAMRNAVTWRLDSNPGCE